MSAAEQLQKILDALQLAQRHDTLQSFNVMRNGACRAVYAGGTITFPSLARLEGFLHYAGTAPSNLSEFEIIINHGKL